MHDDGGSSGDPTRQVKVDNWGIFFLQRLQQFFNRSDHCDLTLQFNGNVKIKVHRLVLNACTEYFQQLEKKVGRNKDNCLPMPTDLSADVVLPIINFMYTGRLEFKDSLTKKLYYTAGRLNMPVLTKLLDAQGATEHGSDPSTPTVTLTPKSAPPAILSKNPTNSFSNSKKLMNKELPETLPGRKLPIWKKRRTPFVFSTFDDSGSSESDALTELSSSSSSKEEPARPTRFEWPEDEEALKTYTPPFDSISYESAPLQSHTPAKALPTPEKKATFEDLQSGYKPVKRQAASSTDVSPKKSKVMDIQSVKEYLQEQEVRKQIVGTEEEGGDDAMVEEGGMALGDVVEDDEDEDEDRDNTETILPDQPDQHEEEGMSGDGETPSTSQHTKSILKQRYTEDATPNKKVRFALSANQEQTYEVADSGEGTSDVTNSPANHAKIISEVLKKYPHLVQNNKNIRLRIMKQGSQSPESEQKDKKVSYVVLKTDAHGKKTSPAKVIVKTGGRIEHLSGLMPSTLTTKPVSGAENTTGPWLCFSCGTNEDPINFETYYSYRRHLQEVHMEKIDARICEHCGHRASKRNLLLYHLFTKHNIPPPRNCQFPKCDQCDYVALSESLLIKHRNNHSNAKDFVCKVCNASFKSNGALQGHMQTNLHSDPDKKKYECPYCQKPFVRNINLKAHIRSYHKEMVRKYEEEEQEAEAALAQEINDVLDPKKRKRRDVLLLRPKDGHVENQHVIATSAQPLEPSSEAEALSNVASGIAASLGLTDHQLAEVHEHQTVVQTLPAADGTVQTFIISAVPGQEYIVPEMLANAAAGEQYQIATTSGLGDLIQYDPSNLGSVVSSLGGVAGQQTIVITTGSSGGQEQLKLVSADGSTLDLLAGQNLLVANADGTTSSAAGAEGYQAILQPNGVLTLQAVGTHVLQEGEHVTEEQLIQQGYVTEHGQVLTLATHDEVGKELEQQMIEQGQLDSKPFALLAAAASHHDLQAQDAGSSQEEGAIATEVSEVQLMATQVSANDQVTSEQEHAQVEMQEAATLEEAEQIAELRAIHGMETAVEHEQHGIAQESMEQPTEMLIEQPSMQLEILPSATETAETTEGDAVMLVTEVVEEQQQQHPTPDEQPMDQSVAVEVPLEVGQEEEVQEGTQTVVEEAGGSSGDLVAMSVVAGGLASESDSEPPQPQPSQHQLQPNQQVEGKAGVVECEIVEGDCMMQEEANTPLESINSSDMQTSSGEAPLLQAPPEDEEEEEEGVLLIGGDEEQGSLMIEDATAIPSESTSAGLSVEESILSQVPEEAADSQPLAEADLSNEVQSDQL